MLIGLDIGGTKIEGVIIDPSSYDIKNRIRIPTPKEGYNHFLQAISSVINRLSKQTQICSIGVGCCGSINAKTGLMQGANLEYLNGKNFLQNLQARFDAPIKIANDADCFAISEYKLGSAKKSKTSCIAIILGTGVGAGIIINGKLLQTKNGLSGEIGHNPLPGYMPENDGPDIRCYCGSKNCIEQFCSGTGFERTFALKYAPMKAVDVFNLARERHAEALKHIQLYTDQLARSMASIVNIIDPDVIVLGGGMSNEESIYPLLKDKINRYTFNKQVDIDVVKALHGDSSGVIGAALLPLLF